MKWRIAHTEIENLVSFDNPRKYFFWRILHTAFNIVCNWRICIQYSFCRRNRLPVNICSDETPAILAVSDKRIYAICSGSDIENAARMSRPRDTVEGEQAAAGGTVMAGAEGERGFDLHTDAMRGDARAVMTAMHDKPAGFDRLQSGKTRLGPIAGRKCLESQRAGGVISSHERQETSYRRLVGRPQEMQFDGPAPIFLERRDGGFGRIEALGEEIRNPSCVRLIGDETRDMDGRQGRWHSRHGD